MNSTTANRMNIAGFLLSIGISPENHNDKDFWYLSPLHNEKTPSLKVNRVKNVWYDFGIGSGGRLVDLVSQLYRVDISGALLILSGAQTTTQSFSFHQQDNNSESNIEIKHIQPLQNRALIQYLDSRGIPFKIASNYIKEAYYNITNSETGEIRKYFALAFENDKSGYELRNKIWKGGTSPKTITTIQGNPNKLNVFEGFMDFLSALVYYQQTEPTNTTIILNSLSHLRNLYSILPNYNQVNLFLDNDQAGQKAANEIQNRFPGAVNQAQIIYPNHKDFNEFICKKLKS
jgi:DNA primase